MELRPRQPAASFGWGSGCLTGVAGCGPAPTRGSAPGSFPRPPPPDLGGSREDGHVGGRTAGSSAQSAAEWESRAPPQGGGAEQEVAGRRASRLLLTQLFPLPPSRALEYEGRWMGSPSRGTRGGADSGDLNPRLRGTQGCTEPHGPALLPAPGVPAPLAAYPSPTPPPHPAPPTPAPGAVHTLGLVAFQSYFRGRFMHGLESRYSAGLSMLRILSTRSPGRCRISSSGIIGFHGLHCQGG